MSLPDESTSKAFELSEPTTLNDVSGQTVAEDASVPSLDDFDEFQSGGAWPVGWYTARVIEGYATQKGTQFTTSDNLSKAGDSRNTLLCLKAEGPGGPRTMMHRINYIPDDFTPQRLAAIKEKLKAGGPRDRHALAVLNIQKLEKALGFQLRVSSGQVIISRAVGHDLDIHVTIDKESGYNEINNFDKLGSHTTKATKANGKA